MWPYCVILKEKRLVKGLKGKCNEDIICIIIFLHQTGEGAALRYDFMISSSQLPEQEEERAIDKQAR